MKTAITQEDVDNFIESVEFSKLGQKTTLAFATLANGFEIAVTSGCVDPSKYNQEIGEKIALGRLKDKVWELLGFELQCRLKDAKDLADALKALDEMGRNK